MTKSKEISLLEVNNLSLSIGESASRKEILKNISFDLNKGEILGFVGDSGSGKSLTAQVLLGIVDDYLHPVQSGEIIWNGDDRKLDLMLLSEKEWNSIRGSEIAMIFQNPKGALNPSVRCGKQILRAMRLGEAKKSKNKMDVLALLQAVHLEKPEKIYTAFPHELSGGEAQRVMIAKALCRKPKLLIADEPTSSLDTDTKHEVLALLRELGTEYGLSVILISHDTSLIKQYSNRTIYIHEGRMDEEAHPPPNFESKVEHYVEAQDIIFEFKNFSKSFSNSKYLLDFQKTKALVFKDLTTSLPANRIISIVGKSGSGKSTLARCMMGLDKQFEGELCLNGKEIRSYEDSKERAGLVQMIFQNPLEALNPRMTIAQSLLEPAGLFLPHFSKKEKDEILSAALTEVGLNSSFLTRYPHEMSGGECQRVCVARALIPKPKFLILDECLSALDASNKWKILDILRLIQRSTAMGMLFITHDMDIAKAVSDRIYAVENYGLKRTF